MFDPQKRTLVRYKSNFQVPQADQQAVSVEVYKDEDYEDLFMDKKLQISQYDAKYSVLDKQAFELMSKMLQYSAKDRISAMEALDHSYFVEWISLGRRIL